MPPRYCSSRRTATPSPTTTTLRFTLTRPAVVTWTLRRRRWQRRADAARRRLAAGRPGHPRRRRQAVRTARTCRAAPIARSVTLAGDGAPVISQYRTITLRAFIPTASDTTPGRGQRVTIYATVGRDALGQPTGLRHPAGQGDLERRDDQGPDGQVQGDADDQDRRRHRHRPVPRDRHGHRRPSSSPPTCRSRCTDRAAEPPRTCPTTPESTRLHRSVTTRTIARLPRPARRP